MARKGRGLGRGLDALFADVAPIKEENSEQNTSSTIEGVTKPSAAKSAAKGKGKPSVKESSKAQAESAEDRVIYVSINDIKPNSAQPRMHFDEDKLKELADSIQAEGFHSDSPVCVDDSGRIIDGLHRVCCAAYLRLESIPVTVYPSSPVFDRVLGDKNRLPERILLDGGFSAEEILFLREAWHEMTGR